MLLQQDYSQRIRSLVEADARVRAALTYGSFSRGEGDRYSDIEFYLFFEPDALAKIDREAWAARVAPVEHAFENEFGTFVVIYAGLVRCELHFESEEAIASVAGWVFERLDPDRMVLKDPEGRLAEGLARALATPLWRDLEAGRREQLERCLNWLMLASNVYQRGEDARTLDALGFVHRFLLRGARLREESAGVARKLDHWLNPMARLEARADPATRARLAACTAPLEPRALADALQASWAWGHALVEGSELESLWRAAMQEALDGISRRRATLASD